MQASFEPGFRLSRTDCGVIVIGGVLAVLAYAHLPPFHWIIVWVVAHFFLFCNVFRFDRLPELIWAVNFTGQVIAHFLGQWVTFPWLFALQGGLTMVLVGLEIRKPGYHGIAWQTLNPGLREWFAANFSQGER